MIRFACLSLVIAACSAGAQGPVVQDGDVIFQTSLSSQSAAIQAATKSPYSHMGMVLYRNGKPFVLEAIATVRYTPLPAFIERGKDKHFVVKRLRNRALLTPTAFGKLRSAAKQFEGKPYDLTFEWTDQRVYCSELVWKVYERALGLRIGELQRLRDFDLEVPVVRAKMHERYGARLPLAEFVVSPGAIFASDLLATVEP